MELPLPVHVIASELEARVFVEPEVPPITQLLLEEL